MTIDTRTPFKTTRHTYGGFVYQRNEDDQFLYVIERWNGETDIPKDLTCPFTHRQNLEHAIDAYNLLVKTKEEQLMNAASIPTSRAINV
jgi:hypothetical protein